MSIDATTIGYTRRVNKDQWEVVDGPLAEEIFALEGEDRQQFAFQLDDGRTAIYSASAGKRYGVPNRLLFVGIDPASLLVTDQGSRDTDSNK